MYVRVALSHRSSCLSHTNGIFPHQYTIRGCFVNLQANDSFTPAEALTALKGQHGVAGVHFGYPHLMKNFQGQGLKTFFEGVAAALGGQAPLLSMDLNGVTIANKGPEVLAEGLPFTDVLHLNQDEAGLLTSVDLSASPLPLANLKEAAGELLAGGAGLVAITLGEAGAYVAVTSKAERVKAGSRLAHQASRWIGQDILLPPFPLTPGAEVSRASEPSKIKSVFCPAPTEKQPFLLPSQWSRSIQMVLEMPLQVA